MKKNDLFGVYDGADQKWVEQIAAKLALAAEAGDTICLYGEMGAGKTVFTKAFCAELGADFVSSPTFTIVNEYDCGKLTVYHFDLYRIEDEDELYEIGFSEYLTKGGIVIIEWPQMGGTLIPEDAVKVKIERTEASFDTRKITIGI